MKKLMTVEEVAEKLQVLTQTVRTWLRKGKMRGSKISRNWRVREEDLQAFIEENMNVNREEE